MGMKKIRVIVTLLLMVASLVGCSPDKVNKSDTENDLSIVRQFIATDSLNNNDYMLIKQNGYGVISEWISYDENNEITARVECEYEGIFMKEQVTYDSDGKLFQRVIYEREPNGKLVNRKRYLYDELISTEYYKEENDNLSATDTDVTIVRYDDLGRVIRWKTIKEDGSEQLVITEYDEYGLKSETTYLDGEVEYRLELNLKK